ncbi:MAG TPA: alpha-glucosidase [Galbitalea sp.]|jgi:oligo-1,6-glucosidase
MTDTVAMLAGVSQQHSTEWWKSAVIYQVYPRSFSDSNGDGIGDLPGITSRLDYLQRLGVDAIWLSPIYASPGDDNGYDISDYRAIDPMFGTPDDFDRLVAGAHARGMKLVMDLVVNHTSDEHEWFVDSASSIDSPKRDWYWWRSPRPGHEAGEPGAEPNNWESFFSGSTWQLDEASGEYYLHLFSRKQPDLNWENREVRAAVYDMMNWWLDRGVDGFRMDVINLISKDPALPDGVVAPGKTWADGFAHYGYGPRIHEFLGEMHEAVFADRSGDFVTVGEMPGVTVEQARLFTDPARHELDMVFQFEHVGLDHGPNGKFDPQRLDVRELKRSLRRWQDGLAETGWNSLYWNNHDQPRAVSRFGNDREYWSESARALAAVLHLQRGTPYIYQGEELGMTNAPFPDVSDLRDIESLNYFAEVMESPGVVADEVLRGIRHTTRDNARTPMQWTGDRGAGFTTGEPWIATNPNAVSINAASQVGQDGSIFEFYRALIQLRHDDPVVAHGDFEMLAAQHPSLVAFTRRLGSERLLVMSNFDESELDVADLIDLAPWANGERVMGNYPDAASLASPLRPWEVRVLR